MVQNVRESSMSMSLAWPDTFLGTPVKSNTIQYNSCSINFTYCELIHFQCLFALSKNKLIYFMFVTDSVISAGGGVGRIILMDVPNNLSLMHVNGVDTVNTCQYKARYYITTTHYDINNKK